MQNFDIDQHLKAIYGRHPEAEKRPVIGITANHEDIDATLRDKYYEQVVKAGGIPVIIPPVADAATIAATLDRLDGIVFSGGADVNPLWTGEQPSPRLHNINQRRDLPELLMVRLAYNRCVPMLGICRGLQVIVTALGGRVCQDLPKTDAILKHSQDADRSEPTHTVLFDDYSMLASYHETTRLQVNSFHHQAVEEAGPHLVVAARALDGVIAGAASNNDHQPIMGVQWHPEWLGDDGLPVFQWLVNEAAVFVQAKDIHASTITLDSHCDTPMFFPQGVDFGTRDPKLLVDLHKMDDGHQDAVTMVAYLEQPKDGKTFADIAPFPVKGPKEYADLIFDKIEDIVSHHADHLALARNPQELEANRRAGKHTIMLGIENGQAFDHSLDNIDHFAARGIVYTTLCHNGDNDICDSARGTHTWGGLSPFGRDVVARMNSLGVMVDLSHAAESSFYDALEASRTPIVCSHSSCRALCDHPRNLTDDQMRRLAEKGGVMQVTAYNGFLSTKGDADIYTLMDHLRHAADVMGIDHIGLGTDFDGDGGIPGLADSSDMLNFTRELLLHEFTEDDIRKIWGGNWLRVMKEVQAAADKK